MIRLCRPQQLLWFSLLAVLLSTGCESEKMQETHFSIQQNRFIQSLELVESAGVTLQNPELTRQDIDRAMLRMDRGLEQAYQVETDFLQKLDVRLPRLYSEIFIKGVEQYRIGVESSDREQQLQGLNLLSQWGKFWYEQKPAIQNKLVELNG